MIPRYKDTINNRIDCKALVMFRQNLERKYKWAYYIWDNKTIPNTTAECEDIEPVPQVRTTRQEEFKDSIYQKWRSKFNNKKLMSTPGSVEKRRLSRKKSFTSRRRLIITRNSSGEAENQYGTLAGTAAWDAVSNVNKREYQNMRKNMLEQNPNTSPALLKELIRLWEVVYAKVNDISQADLTLWNQNGDLIAVQHYLYYEGYARTICQLNKDCKTFLANQLYSVAEVLPQIFRSENFTYKLLTKEDYSNTPLIATLLEIAGFFGESHEFHVSLPSAVNTTEQITNVVCKNPLCNVILNYNYFNTSATKRFGVAVQGVPFISNLSEEEASTDCKKSKLYLFIYLFYYNIVFFQAVFVFCTAADIFGFKPDRENQPKKFRINNMIEFVRRCCLGIMDSTEPEWMGTIKE